MLWPLPLPLPTVSPPRRLGGPGEQEVLLVPAVGGNLSLTQEAASRVFTFLQAELGLGPGATIWMEVSGTGPPPSALLQMVEGLAWVLLLSLLTGGAAVVWQRSKGPLASPGPWGPNLPSLGQLGQSVRAPLEGFARFRHDGQGGGKVEVGVGKEKPGELALEAWRLEHTARLPNSFSNPLFDEAPDTSNLYSPGPCQEVSQGLENPVYLALDQLRREADLAQGAQSADHLAQGTDHHYEQVLSRDGTLVDTTTGKEAKMEKVVNTLTVGNVKEDTTPGDHNDRKTLVDTNIVDPVTKETLVELITVEKVEREVLVKIDTVDHTREETLVDTTTTVEESDVDIIVDTNSVNNSRDATPMDTNTADHIREDPTVDTARREKAKKEEVLVPGTVGETITGITVDTDKVDNFRVVGEPGSCVHLVDTSDLLTTKLVEPTLSQLVDTTVSQLVDTTVTQLVNTKVTQLVDTPLTQLVDTMVTKHVDTTPTHLVDTTVTNLVDTTPTQLVDTTAIQLVDSRATAAAAAQLVETTTTQSAITNTIPSTQLLDETETQHVDTTSAQLIDTTHIQLVETTGIFAIH